MTLALRIAAQLFNEPLLVLPDTAATIAGALADRFGTDPLGEIEPVSYRPDEIEASRFRGTPSGPRRPDGSTIPAYRVIDGVALLPVMGELVNRGAWIGSFSGLTSYEGLEASLLAARDDPDVRAIALDLNSPGGQASGAMETGALVRRVSADKPVVAYVNGLAASAAYAIAAGASEIVTTPTGMTGSIGVVWMHLDRSAAIARAGLKPTIIQAGAHKTDGHPLAALPDDARTRIQARIDGLYTLFVDHVAAHRPIDAAAVRATQAGIFMGADAVAVGLADKVGTLDDVLSSLTIRPAGLFPGLTLKGTSMDTVAKADHDKALADLGASHAAALATLRTEHETALAAALAKATGEAVTAERARFKAIVGHDEARGRESLAAHLAFETDAAPDAALATLKASPKAEPAKVGPMLDGRVPNPEVKPDEARKPDAAAASLSGAVDRLIAGLPKHA